MSAARTRKPPASPAGASPSARASRNCGRSRTSCRFRQAPNLPDSVLDQLVSSIIVEREQIGPTRYIADLGVLFDRARAGQLLGIGGVEQRSQPMLLIPVTISAGTATSVELRNAWQRAWAQFRTSQSPIDYVRISGMGADPLADQRRPDPPSRARLVAQHPRPLRRVRHPGRRSAGAAALSGRAGAGALHRPPRARRRDRRQLHAAGGQQRRDAADDGRGRAAHGPACSPRRSRPASCSATRPSTSPSRHRRRPRRKRKKRTRRRPRRRR